MCVFACKCVHVFFLCVCMHINIMCCECIVASMDYCGLLVHFQEILYFLTCTLKEMSIHGDII